MEPTWQQDSQTGILAVPRRLVDGEPTRFTRQHQVRSWTRHQLFHIANVTNTDCLEQRFLLPAGKRLMSGGSESPVSSGSQVHPLRFRLKQLLCVHPEMKDWSMYNMLTCEGRNFWMMLQPATRGHPNVETLVELLCRLVSSVTFSEDVQWCMCVGFLKGSVFNAPKMFSTVMLTVTQTCRDWKYKQTELDSLFWFRNHVDQSAICSAIGQHPLPRTRHEATDCPIEGLPVTTTNQSRVCISCASVLPEWTKCHTWV